MIRLAVASDVPRLVEMGQRFRKESEYHRHYPDNPEQLAKLTAQLIACDGALLCERAGQIVGMFGYVLYPHLLSGELVAAEVCWWVEPEHRGEGIKLLREAEKLAQARGAQQMQMIAPNDKVANLYQRLGYVFVEAAYQRSL
jgi:GNAT superfamily N-acetyltransferase